EPVPVRPFSDKNGRHQGGAGERHRHNSQNEDGNILGQLRIHRLKLGNGLPLWQAQTDLGTTNRFVLVLVVLLVFDSKPPNRGGGGERRRGRKSGSWVVPTLF